MNIGEKIRNLRIEKQLTQEELADAVGTKKQTIHKYETGIIENIPASKIKAIADKLNTTPAYLMGWDETRSDRSRYDFKQIKFKKIPVLGTVAAGLPIDAVENIIDYEDISLEMASSGEYFALKIKGNSMYPRIVEGDVVIVKKQSDVESGDVAIVLINGDEATVKTVKKQTDGIILTAYNSDVWEPKYYSNSEIEALPISILGKVVELRGKF